ncbi:MAG: hypothetical protein FJZ60_03160 [Chlamydiae bacterium]|nr:hypothetical protein [Chlamydiota bacterium]
MAKNLPYLFGGAVTVGSVLALSFLTPFKDRFFTNESIDPFKGLILEIKSHQLKRYQQDDCAQLDYALPLVGCDYKWDITAAATYSRPALQAVDVALITNDRQIAIYPVAASGVQPQEDFAWGFKIFGAYKLDYGLWRLRSEYNFYKNIVNTSLKVTYGQGFAPSSYANTAVDNLPFSSAIFTNLETGNYTFLNNLRLSIARPSLITPNLEVTTLFGFDANFLQRRQVAVFTNAVTDTPTSGFIGSLGGFFQNYQKYTWWGVGPSIGFETRWNLGSNFFFHYDAFGDVTFGPSTMRTATFSKRVIIGPPSLTYQPQEAAVQNIMSQFAPSMRYLIGIDYKYLFHSKQMQLNLEIAYETQYYFNVIRTLVPEGSFRSENGAGFGIQGLVLQAGITF